MENYYNLKRNSLKTQCVIIERYKIKMKVIFGTTNKRKIEDLLNIITNNNLDIEVLTLEDINWDEGEIEENGKL